VLSVHPRGDVNRPRAGVFSTRSPDRPNPIGLHAVRIEDVGGNGITVHHLEAIDGTPVLDIKPVLGETHQR
jgi:tRNA-Thr(GGU) m(6)t(6)A37 methyltransferase TsaA